MEKKISVEAQIDLETIDEKILKVLQARDAFLKAVSELYGADFSSSFKFAIKGSPLPGQDKAS